MSEDVEYEDSYVEGSCCPDIKPIGCKHNGEVFDLDSANAIGENRCETLYCSINREGKVLKKIQQTVCNETCPEGFTYRKKPKACCGECIQVACILPDNITKAKGEIWIGEDGCQRRCTICGNRYVVQVQRKYCPPVRNCAGIIRKRNCCDYCDDEIILPRR